MQTMNMVVGTRGSALALWQANWVRDRLVLSRHAAEINIIQTSGDREARPAPAAAGVKGLFIKEIEEALLQQTIDLAVHSLKDLPLEQPPGLVIAAICGREDARDALVCRAGVLPDGTGGSASRFADLPAGARVATGSLRRLAQLRHLRPDLEYVPIRGNVDTRLRKLDAGECDALVLAAAGLLRLGFDERIAELFDPGQLCPAPGQGALAIETRADNARGNLSAARAAGALEDRTTRLATRAERAVVWALGADCSSPVGACALPAGGSLSLTAVVASPDGSRLIRASASGALTRPEELGTQVADDLVRQGAREILDHLA